MNSLLIDLAAVTAQLLTAYKQDRDALFAACTVGGNPDTLEADDRAYIEVMDELIEHASHVLAVAQKVLHDV
jgi:hypothetical protein